MNENRPRSEDAQGRTAQMRDTVRETAANIADGAKEQAREQYDRKKEVALGELDRLASALRKAGDELGGTGVSGKVISNIADRVQSFSRSLDGKDLGAVLNDFDRLAHRNPAAFFGGAVALGFLASRFLKSTSPTHGRSDFYSDEPYGGGYGGSDFASGSGYVSTGRMSTSGGPTSGTDFGRTGSSLGTGLGTASGNSPGTTSPSDLGSTGSTGTSGIGSTETLSDDDITTPVSGSARAGGGGKKPGQR